MHDLHPPQHAPPGRGGESNRVTGEGGSNTIVHTKEVDARCDLHDHCKVIAHTGCESACDTAREKIRNVRALAIAAATLAESCKNSRRSPQGRQEHHHSGHHHIGIASASISASATARRLHCARGDPIGSIQACGISSTASVPTPATAAPYPLGDYAMRGSIYTC